MTIVAVGDSWLAPGSPLVPALSRATGRRVVARGIVGARVSTWLDRPASARAAGRGAGVVLVHLGGNAGRHDAGAVRRLDALFRAGGAPVVWLPPGPWPAGRMHDRQRSMMRALAGAGVRVLPVRVHRMTRGMYDRAGVHVGRVGARVWARQVAAELLGV